MMGKLPKATTYAVAPLKCASLGLDMCEESCFYNNNMNYSVQLA